MKSQYLHWILKYIKRRSWEFSWDLEFGWWDYLGTDWYCNGSSCWRGRVKNIYNNHSPSTCPTCDPLIIFLVTRSLTFKRKSFENAILLENQVTFTLLLLYQTFSPCWCFTANIRLITHTSVFSFLKVIITNQVLHSMITNPRPTRYFITEYVDERSTKKNKVGNHSFDFICRAECTDIVNAIFDGADCFCLTNTTAEGSSNWYLEVEVEKNKVPLIYCHRTSFLTRNFFLGTYPVKTVKMLLKQCRETEKAIPYRDVYIQNHKKKQISLHFSYRI
jgi:hypothetical protein